MRRGNNRDFNEPDNGGETEDDLNVLLTPYVSCIFKEAVMVKA